MKYSRYFLLIVAIASAASGYCQHSPASLLQYKRVLFLGNSITYDGTFISDIETFIRLKYPKADIDIINEGLPSETVSGLSEPGHADNRFPRPDLHERLQRVLDLTKPDVVFACYGMNDGIYMPLDDERFEKYKRGVRWLHDEVVKTGAAIIHITPPFYDERRGKNTGYENTLDHYAAWILSMKDSEGWNVIDIYNPLKKYLYAHRNVDEQFHLDGFDLAADGVHPNANAHWLMARTILNSMNEKGVDTISSVEVFCDMYAHGKQVLKLVRQKQSMMKDAWLTAAGHKRPEMKKGLPLSEAKQKEGILNRKIRSLTE